MFQHFSQHKKGYLLGLAVILFIAGAAFYSQTSSLSGLAGDLIKAKPSRTFTRDNRVLVKRAPSFGERLAVQPKLNVPVPTPDVTHVVSGTLSFASLLPSTEMLPDTTTDSTSTSAAASASGTTTSATEKQTLLKFTMTSQQEDIKLNQLSFDVVNANLSTTEYELEVADAQGTRVLATSGAKAHFAGLNYVAGLKTGAVTFTLKATLFVPANTNGAVTATLTPQGVVAIGVGSNVPVTKMTGLAIFHLLQK